MSARLVARQSESITRHHPEDASEPSEWFSVRSGRRIQLCTDEESDRIVISSAGITELSIRLTAQGPVAELRGHAIDLAATKEVSVRCTRFVVDATEGVKLATAGDIQHEAGGDMVAEVAGRATVKAHAVEVTARRGNVDVHANDDVTLTGERIYLNR